MGTERPWLELKQEGNELFKNSSYLKAAARYTNAIKTFEGETDELAVLHRCESKTHFSLFWRWCILKSFGRSCQW